MVGLDVLRHLPSAKLESLSEDPNVIHALWLNWGVKRNDNNQQKVHFLLKMVHFYSHCLKTQRGRQ